MHAPSASSAPGARQTTRSGTSRTTRCRAPSSCEAPASGRKARPGCEGHVHRATVVPVDGDLWTRIRREARVRDNALLTPPGYAGSLPSNDCRATPIPLASKMSPSRCRRGAADEGAPTTLSQILTATSFDGRRVTVRSMFTSRGSTAAPRARCRARPASWNRPTTHPSTLRSVNSMRRNASTRSWSAPWTTLSDHQLPGLGSTPAAGSTSDHHGRSGAVRGHPEGLDVTTRRTQDRRGCHRSPSSTRSSRTLSSDIEQPQPVVAVDGGGE